MYQPRTSTACPLWLPDSRPRSALFFPDSRRATGVPLFLLFAISRLPLSRFPLPQSDRLLVAPIGPPIPASPSPSNRSFLCPSPCPLPSLISFGFPSSFFPSPSGPIGHLGSDLGGKVRSFPLGFFVFVLFLQVQVARLTRRRFRICC